MSEFCPAGRNERYAVRSDDGPLVKRLRRRPLTPQTWVRFPYGSPLKSKLRIVRFHINVKAHSLHCFFVPNFKRFAGLKFGGEENLIMVLVTSVIKIVGAD